jgi:hypothetical protein
MPRPGNEIRFPLLVRNRTMIEEVWQGERQERWKLRTVVLGRIWRILHLTFAFKEMRQLADASLPGGLVPTRRPVASIQ